MSEATTGGVRRKLIALFVLTAGAVSFFAFRPTPETVRQPIAFNHQLHMAQEMNCIDCHRGAKSSTHATLPTLKQCMLCHSEAQGEHPDEPKIREYAERKEPIPWILVNRLPGHVYFSHEAHVTGQGMDCRECHGEMKDRTEPVVLSQITHLTMKRCMDCHEQKGASNDCMRCHK